MNQNGRDDSSTPQKEIVSINFRLKDNDEKQWQMIDDIVNMQRIFVSKPISITVKLIIEGKSLYILLNTNLTNRPIKLLIDTGATLTLIAKDAITNASTFHNYTVNLYGLPGKEAAINTLGITSGTSTINNCKLGITFHLIDRKYTGGADGYLGFDFLTQYKAIIDIGNATMTLRLNEINNIEKITTPGQTDNNLNAIEQHGSNTVSSQENQKGTKNENEKKSKQKVKRDKKRSEKYNEEKNEKPIEIENNETSLDPENDKKHNENMQGNQECYTIRVEDIMENGLNGFSADDFEGDCDGKYYNICENYERISTIHTEKMEGEKTKESKRAKKIFGKLKLNHCTEEEKQNIEKICDEFAQQFYLEGDTLGCTEVIKHEIKLLPDSKPVSVRQYRIPHIQRQILEKMIEEYEKQGIIEKCTSNYNSPLLLVAKKDDFGNKTDFRFVIDYRKLNEITETRIFPIPRIEDILDGLSGRTLFTTLDIKGAFHQIELTENSRNYTAFTAGNFQYHWRRMPMGLAMSPLTWQRAINTILSKLIGHGVYVYLDDVIIYAKTREEHDLLLRKVLNRLQRHNLQLKISKCIFYAREFEFLGHIISRDGIRTNPKKIEAVKNFPRPKNMKELQSFLGLCNYYRRFVKSYSHIAKPLTRLCKKEEPFIWTEFAQNAFEKLKETLAKDVTLAFPDFNQTFYVTTDASDYAVGGVLSQGDIPNDRPICFFSRTLNDAQRRYSVTHRELLAMVESTRAFRQYIWGRFFIMITDHKALCYLFNMKDCGSRLFRQKIELMDYNFKVIHRPGPLNSVADALSRMKPLTIEELQDIQEKQNDHTCHAVTRAQAQRNLDKNYSIIEKSGTILNKRGFDIVFHFVPTENGILNTKLEKKFGKINLKPEWTNIGGDHFACKISNQFANGNVIGTAKTRITEIHKMCRDQQSENIAVNIHCDGMRHQLHVKNIFAETFNTNIISITMFTNSIIEIDNREDVDKILKLYHESLLGGHFGTEKMLQTMGQFYKWKNMEQDIKRYVKDCGICEKSKYTKNVKMPMQISSLGEMLFDHCYIDYVGPIAQSIDGYTSIFTATCDVTKLMIAVPTRDMTAETTAECLLEHVLLRYNFPSRIISDNAQSFNSNTIKEINKLLQIKKIFTTPYHPQSNIVERQHRSLNSYMRSFTQKNKDIWSRILKYATFAYNNSVHSTTGYTPHELAHGFRIQIPNSLIKPRPRYNYDNLAEDVRQNITNALKLAKEALHNRKISNKQYYDQKVNEIDIQVGDMILIKAQTKPFKFSPAYIGPYEVNEVAESYIEITRDGRKMKVHKNLVKKSLATRNDEIPMNLPIVILDEHDTIALVQH